MISVTIKPMNGRAVTLSVPADMTVVDFKHEVAQALGVEVDRQRLIYAGKVLKDGDALSNCKFSVVSESRCVTNLPNNFFIS